MSEFVMLGLLRSTANFNKSTSDEKSGLTSDIHYYQSGSIIRLSHRHYQTDSTVITIFSRLLILVPIGFYESKEYKRSARRKIINLFNVN